MRNSDPKKILVIIPIVNTQVLGDVQNEVGHVLAPDFQAVYQNVSQGTCVIESRYAEFLNTADIISLSKTAQDDGLTVFMLIVLVRQESLRSGSW